MKSARRNHLRGSAMLLVLWALLLLSAAVFAWAVSIQNNIAVHSDTSRAVEARAAAHSGMTVALHPRVSRQTPLPEEQISPGVSYQVRMISEGGKLNINWLLRGEEPRKLLLLKQWLERRGLKSEEREVFVDCLLDYVDGDDLHRLNGREDEGDYHPTNRELTSVEEIAGVAGSTPLVSQPGWQDELTIYSQGPIDVGSASADMLRLLPGLGESRIQQFIKYRQGEDGIDGTVDDPVFKNLGVVQSYLGLSASQFKELSGLIAYRDPTLNIVSTGRSGNVTRQLEVVVRKGGGKPQILLWKE